MRFVILIKDPDSGRRQGLFQTIELLDGDPTLRPEERELLNETYEWFRNTLPAPDRLARSAKPHAKKVAVSWFKDVATEHIAKMRTLADLLSEHGYPVEMLRTSRPGYIVYEDEFQIAAEPFADTPA